MSFFFAEAVLNLAVLTHLFLLFYIFCLLLLIPSVAKSTFPEIIIEEIKEQFKDHLQTVYYNFPDLTSANARCRDGRRLLQFNDLLYNIKFSDLSKFLNADGRYECPRRNCNKNYKDASSLQRHIR